MTTGQFEQGVGLLMLAMGLSLSMDDFRKVRRVFLLVLFHG